MDFSELSARAPWRDRDQPQVELHRLVAEAFIASAPVPACAPAGGEFEPDHGWPFHPYPELFLQLAGRRTFRCPGGTVAVEAGQAVVVPRGVPHQERGQDLGQGEACLVVIPAPAGLGVNISSMAGTAYLPWSGAPRHSGYVDPGSGLDRLCDAIAEAVRGAGPAGEARTLLTAALWLVHRRLAAGERSEGDLPAGLAGRCRRLVDHRLTSHHLGVDALALELGVSADHLGRAFKAATGETLVGHILRRRLEQAADLLRTSRLPVRSAAWACGFRDPLYFSRMFRRRFGASPRTWRDRG